MKHLSYLLLILISFSSLNLSAARRFRSAVIGGFLLSSRILAETESAEKEYEDCTEYTLATSDGAYKVTNDDLKDCSNGLRGFLCDEETPVTINEIECTSWQESTVYNYNSSCFPSNTLVHTERGPVQMANLTAGDEIYDAEGNLVKVEDFLHFVEEKETYITSFYDSEGRLIIEASPTHLLFSKGQKTKYARDFKVGEELFMGNGSSILINSIIIEKKEAAMIAPLTTSGHLLVGPQKIKASCFPEVSHPDAAYWYTRGRRFLFGDFKGNPADLELHIAWILSNL